MQSKNIYATLKKRSCVKHSKNIYADQPQADRFVPIKEVCWITGFSPVTVWREENANRFPKRRKISARRVGWLESEIREWVQSRAAQSGEAE